MTPKELLEFKYKNPFKKGKHLKRIKKPWSKREVVFVCSNGFTIEKIEYDDWPLEGYFMGHCLGGKNGPPKTYDYWSLREKDGTPHTTIRISFNGQPIKLIGRCNKYPKKEYQDLINEYMSHMGLMLFDSKNVSFVETEEDDEYHKNKILNDKDYRDYSEYSYYRDFEWRNKRKV